MTPRTRSAASTRSQFSYRLEGYSALGVAALATAVVAGGTAADAQGITNLNAASFGGSLPVSTVSHDVEFPLAGGSVGFRVHSYNGGYAINAQARLYGNLGLQFVMGDGGHLLAKNDKIGAGFGTVFGVPYGGSSGTGVFVGLFSTAGGGGLAAGGKLVAAGHNAAATGYIGLKVSNGHASNHYIYGWLRVQVKADGTGRPASISLVPDAYGNVGAYALDSILTGQVDPTAIPEPANVAAGLGLMALGAVGVRELRRRRQQRAA